jgi:ABC-2 type transport system ATP-binding protein
MWNDNAPIYRQLKEKVVGMMLDGVLKPGDALPSVRQIAADYQLNPITVSRAYQELVDETLVEKRRGLGMYVTDGARDKLLATERERFLREDWPAMLERIRRLGLDLETLLHRQRREGGMSAIITASGLRKQYGKRRLDGLSFSIEAGRIVGLIGPNGSGKTTTLKAILGLTPSRASCRCWAWTRAAARCADERGLLHRRRGHPAQVAEGQGGHRFRRRRASALRPQQGRKIHGQHQAAPEMKVKAMSKGMVVQLHLALVMAIDARLLVLDEPTLGLDILYRKQFYQNLLEDYFDENKTILITTHQIEEVEHILSDLMFIRDGKIELAASMDEVGERFTEVMVEPQHPRRTGTAAASTSAPCSARHHAVRRCPPAAGQPGRTAHARRWPICSSPP